MEYAEISIGCYRGQYRGDTRTGRRDGSGAPVRRAGRCYAGQLVPRWTADRVCGAQQGSGQRSICRSHRGRSEEHTSELQSLMRISYAVFCLKKKNTQIMKCSHQIVRAKHTQSNYIKANNTTMYI